MIRLGYSFYGKGHIIVLEYDRYIVIHFFLCKLIIFLVYAVLLGSKSKILASSLLRVCCIDILFHVIRRNVPFEERDPIVFIARRRRDFFERQRHTLIRQRCGAHLSSARLVDR